ncbi:MAG: CHAP domain-containing protein, partial [Lachnospiraceae bacterium]|nr:CHAP domain-containing protein [Lachnospiraceae bacterium]
MTKKSTETSERLIRRRNRNLWRIAVTPLAAALVIAVAYNLIIPAITMSRQVAYCGHEEHAHLPECYSEQGEIICGMEEHEHSLVCYTDLNADIENADLWEQEAPVPTGDRSADVLAVAKSLLGYRESEKNYLVAEGGETKGYTRFGHWYGLITGDGSAEEADEATQDGQTQALANGIPDYSYWDWDAMFVSYVLSYAGVGDMGSDTDAANWAASLTAAGRYVDAQDYVPSPGDLIFFTPYDDKPVMVGVVSYINNDFLGLGDGVKSISVICGDYDNQVSEIRIAMDESGEGDLSFGTIRGYGLLNPDASSDNFGQAVSETEGGADAQGDLQNQVPADTHVADEAAKALEGDESLAGQTDESGQTSSDQTDKGGRSLVGGMDESDRTLADQMDEDDQSLASRTDTGKTSADADESGPLYEEQPGDEKQSDSANENPTDSDNMACTLLPGETRILTANGADYTVTMTYGAEAEIPDIAKLQVKEIKAGTDDYEECLSDTRETLGIDEEDADKLHGRFFDIKIMTKEGEFEPKSPVKVEISYKKPIEAAEASDFHAIHFGEDGTERIDVET